MLDKQTILQEVIKEELKEFLKKEEQNLYKSQDLLSALSLTDGSYTKELNTSSGSVANLLSNERLAVYSKVSSVSPKEYMTQLGQNIIKVEEQMKIKSAIELAVHLHEQLGDSLAGIIAITEKGALINLLHHIVAVELTPTIFSNTEIVSKLIVFTFKDLEEIKLQYNPATTPELEAIMDQTINEHILGASTILEPRYIKIVRNDISLENRSIVQQYAISKGENEIRSKEYYLTVHQLLTRSTFVPYYGVTIVAIPSSGSPAGHHVSFTKGANISNHGGTSGNVCCGSKSNRTIEGLRTQHHSNLSSPYNSNCMTTASYAYIKKCIEKSISIYRNTLNIPLGE
jgi:hypothetical protein